MAANYLHGVETVTVNSGVVPVSVIKTAVVGLVGIAPTGPKNSPVLVSSPKDAAQFGLLIPGFNIPQALAAIFAQGPATVLVVNTFDAVSNTVAVVAESATVTGGKFKTDFAPVANVEVKNAGGTMTYVLGTDYTFDAFGNFKAVGPAITDGTTLQVDYLKLDAASVTAAQLVGTINETTADRTGFKCFDLALNVFGFNPKVLIAPGYSQLAGVKAELVVLAAKYRALALIDAAPSTSPAAAIADRGPAGTTFNVSDKRVVLLYPHLKTYDAATDSETLLPYSAVMAGLICATDYAEGYHVSPSNQVIKGVTGIERQLTAAINDPNSEVNGLNAAGITTIFNAYGSGLRSWGNRNSSFPATTDPANFIPIVRVSDIVAESIEYSMLAYADRPLTPATIDAVKETVNSFLRTLVGRGAIIDGECKFDRSKNSDAELAAGHVVFDYSLMPPPPMERMTFNHFIDVSLLKVIR